MSYNYVLITPAHNEEKFIEATIKAVLLQTLQPIKWVIVNDGSTDNTPEIVTKYSVKYEWIDYVAIQEHSNRDFASKVFAFNKGLEQVTELQFDVIGCLDADITFESDYFEYLMKQFEKEERLGVAGTHYVEGNFHSYNDSYINEHHVNGGCQLFRKDCFEKIGGYKPNKAGGIDWIAVTTARMKGWNTNSFAEKVFFHHRAIGTAGSNILKSRFCYGVKDFYLGGSPIWEVFRAIYNLNKKPYIIGGVLIMFGYFYAWVAKTERPISNELLKFYRKEQLKRLKNLIKGKFNIHR